MGLKWAKPKNVSNNTLIVTETAFPEKPLAEAIWTLWRSKKDSIKKDGFSIGKDKYHNKWNIKYFHKVTADSTKIIDGNTKMNWRIEFDERVAKYKIILEGLAKTTEKNTGPRDNRKVQPRRGQSAHASDSGESLPVHDSYGIDASQLVLEMTDAELDLELA